MICNFPVPYPDEILYSIFARYSDRMRYLSTIAVARDLIGREKPTRVSLPNCLGRLIDNLPPQLNHTVAGLIDHHTLLPFYEPFLPPGRSSLLRQFMEAEEANQVEVLLGVRNQTLPTECTRFCPRCVQEDRKQFGECYWHRVHQIPGVEVCPTHNIYLRSCREHSRGTGTIYRFLSAERMIGSEPRFLEETNNTCDEWLDIARDILWLLKNPNLGRDLSYLQKKYYLLLANRGFVAQSGRLFIGKLLQSFQEHYATGLLEQLRCELSGSHSNDWLVLLPRNTKMMYPPVRHLLLMHFLGYTIETFLKLSMDQLSTDQLPPFGDGPWPCLNPICPRYLERCIQNCEVIYRNMIDGRPRGKFTCECGFTYSRIGPDRSEEDLFRSSRIKIYGTLWETKLKELWEDPSVSFAKASQALGLTKHALRRQAKRLGLLSPEAVSQPKPSHEAESNYWVNNHTVNGPNPALRERYREMWISTKDANPEDGASRLKNKIPKIHRWLYTNDRAWLLSHSPTTRQRKYPNRRPPAPFVDWKERDKQFAAEVRPSALLIKNTSNRPVQVTVYGITKNMDRGASVRNNLERLPLTAQTLAEFVETDEAFALHRVQWVIECYRRENICPTRAQILDKGNLRKSQEKWISVRNAIDDAMRTFGADRN